jgi:hypothetical protein
MLAEDDRPEMLQFLDTLLAQLEAIANRKRGPAKAVSDLMVLKRFREGMDSAPLNEVYALAQSAANSLQDVAALRKEDHEHIRELWRRVYF